MKIQQFYDKHLSHASYVILNEGKIALIDPARDPQQYYDFANDHNAEIIYVLETHPHADFVSSHLEIKNKTGADILINELAGPTYDFRPFNHDDEISLGKLTIQALHTPGHSPDSNSYLITDPRTKEQALFTGDFLFIGDVGRPDLRESVGSIKEARKDLAEAMYTSITTILPILDDDVIIYPAHGAGSLCGKNLSNELFDTLGNQRKNNWALQGTISKEDFINTLLSDQPFIPKYFTHCVEVNRNGASDFKKFIEGKKLSYEDMTNKKSFLVIDTRNSEAFRSGSYKKALNIPASDSDNFETWLGSIIAPDEKFILIVESEESAHKIYGRIQKIGYEKNIQGYYIADTKLTDTKVLSVESDIQNQHEYLFLDIRQEHEHHEHKAFEHAQNIPLSVLRESIDSISTDKPVVVHCAGGYRSAIGASIIAVAYPDLEVYDMSVRIKKHLN
jgi:glyoxylase-like metal-dependent hydrolase (beta-lactamase superfamily II)/rhodanese-related sulfurtransferase